MISKTKLLYDDFKDINYIWFSHEHPDHFYPPNIKLIPEKYKKNITVLFQNTIDGRVAEYCKRSGLKEVVELHKGQEYDLATGFRVSCEHFSEGVSWIYYKADNLTILNTNDCGVRNQHQVDHIKNRTGKVDILLTQFSYAYWAGNRDEVEYRQQIADKKLEAMKYQCDNFEPKVTIPIASYIYFCHQENFYLNDSINTAEKTFKYLNEHTQTKPVILYNGDEYTFDQEWDSLNSIEQYKEDFRQIEMNSEKLVKNKKVELNELLNQAKLFTKNLKKTNNFVIKSLLKDSIIHLSDYDITYKLSLSNGLEEDQTTYEKCDVSMSSESLIFCMKFPFGLDTTQINGRLQKPKKGIYNNVYNFFRIDQQKSRGHEMTLTYLIGVFTRKILIKLNLYKT